MLRKEIKYYDIENNEIVEKTKIAYFHSCLLSMKLYEGKTGRDFWIDKSNVVKKIYLVLTNSNEKEVDFDLISLVLSDREINQFFSEYFACSYVKMVNSQMTINDDTYEEAYNSLWISELIDFEFYLEFLDELFKGKKISTSNQKKKISN
ncbi:hypothetical protein V7101_20710 [Bacillus velezensis]|uniref:hypothetical protein n=1 Tax=Bacillus velezensis TaxID=492670 RepID=UPI002FFF13FD